MLKNYFSFTLGIAEVASDVLEVCHLDSFPPAMNLLIFSIGLIISPKFYRSLRLVTAKASRMCRDGRIFILPFFLFWLLCMPAVASDTVARYIFLPDISESMIWRSRLVNDPQTPGQKIILFDQIKREMTHLVQSLPASQHAEIFFFPFAEGICDEKAFFLSPDSERKGSNAEIATYINELQATGKETFIFSTLEKVIQRFHNQATSTNKAIATTLFLLTDGVDTGPDYENNLLRALALFRDWVNTTEYNKPYLFTMHLLPENLPDGQDKLAMEKEAFKTIPNAGIVTSIIGQEPKIRILRPRISSIDFEYWQPGETLPAQKKLPFEWITSEKKQETIHLDFIPVFKRNTNDVPPGVEIIFNKASAVLKTEGSGIYVADIQLTPVLDNGRPDTDFYVEGQMAIKTDEGIQVQPDDVTFKLHIGGKPLVSFHARENPKPMRSNALPTAVNWTYQIQKTGRVEGRLSDVKVFWADATGFDAPSPVLSLTDKSGANTRNWDLVEYAKITIPVSKTLCAGRHTENVVIQTTEKSPFLFSDGNGHRVKSLHLPVTLEVLKPPKPLWLRLAALGMSLVVLLAGCIAVYYHRKPSFGDVELQLIKTGDPDNVYSSGVLDRLVLKGKKPVTTGTTAPYLTSFVSTLVWRPDRSDGRDLLLVRNTGSESVDLMSQENEHQDVQMHTGRECEVTGGDVLTCGDFSIRVASVTYQREEDPLDSTY